MLTEQQIERYSRQIILPRVGGRGQERLLASRVALVGAGALGGAAALYLGAAGVGALTIVDDATVGDEDVQWGVIPSHRDRWTRAEATAATLEGLNPDCRISSLSRHTDAALSAGFARDHDVLLDASCRPEISAALNAAAIAARKPLVWGTVGAALGQMAVFRSAPCYQCYRASSHAVTFHTRGGRTALGVIAAQFIGTLQAVETIKILFGFATVPADRLLVCTFEDMSIQQVTLTTRLDCDVCSAVPAVAGGGSVR